MLEVHSTKTFMNLPCAHAQYFDLEADGTPGECASIHGYDRSVRLTFSGSVDEHGWIVPFGELKVVKEWIEYYFDHTTCLPADDPRLGEINAELLKVGGLLNTVRVLPYGVSMEMSSLFIIEHIGLYIMYLTKGRCYVSKVECFEHERNSAFVTMDRGTADAVYARALSVYGRALDSDNIGAALLPKEQQWPFVPPQTVLNVLNSLQS